VRVFIRADSSVSIGAGHVARCLTLARYLRLQGSIVSFICSRLPGNLISLIRAQGFSVYELEFANAEGAQSCVGIDSEAREREDATKTLSVLSREGAVDWVIVDHYGLTHRWETMIRSKARNILVIDDLVEDNHDCDLLLNQNPLPDLPARYHGRIPSRCKLLSGSTFALLRPQFAELRAVLVRSYGPPRRILIAMGGADEQGVTMVVLKTIEDTLAAALELNVVVGYANPHKSQIREFCSNSESAIYYEQTDRMPELIAAADIAIGAGGSSQWERCCLGLPSITVAIARNQEETMQILAENGGCMYLGPADALEPSRLEGAIDELVVNADRRRAMSQFGARLVDGSGTERVASTIFELS
jgi:UDP-2,4-diacetamido-2,4,6-trideoxy-beta-L-altropyranose hydrolase